MMLCLAIASLSAYFTWTLNTCIYKKKMYFRKKDLVLKGPKLIEEPIVNLFNKVYFF
jgi:hypothetical protein